MKGHFYHKMDQMRIPAKTKKRNTSKSLFYDKCERDNFVTSSKNKLCCRADFLLFLFVSQEKQRF
jgi:hypothetical protein